LIGIPRWIHWHAIHEIKIGRSCDILRRALAKELDSVKLARANDARVIAAQTHQLEVERTGARLAAEQRDNAEERAGLWKKQNKRSKWIKVGAGGAAIIAGILGAGPAVIIIIACVPAADELRKK
jgi:hypothetical protein